MSTAQPIEVELKLAVRARDLPRLRRRLQRFGPPQRMQIETAYYDTPDGVLAAHGFALRLRRVGRRWFQTLKQETEPAALAQRGEWEWPLRAGRLDPALLAATPLAPLLAKCASARFVELFRTRFAREAWTVAHAAARIEVALDVGEIRAGARSEPIGELELELKSGTAAALSALARRIACAGPGRALALLPLPDSKARRGQRLAAGTAPQPVKAQPQRLVAGLRADDDAEAALKRALGRAIEVLLADAHGALAHDDPEFVHQARVALRRIRTALRLLRRHVAVPKRLARDLRWMACALGAARDWDVIVDEVLPEIEAALDAGLAPACARLRAEARRRRARERDTARAALASPRLACAMLALLAWCQAQPRDGGVTLQALAGTLLTRRHARLFAAARGFASLPPKAQHRVRILTKRLRYALDFFAVALPARAAARYAKRLAALQDDLGALNDVAVAYARLRGLARPRALREALDAWAERQRRAHAAAAARRLARLRRHPVPWQGAGSDAGR
jgi:inorganic triphosphatase YgiF